MLESNPWLSKVGQYYELWHRRICHWRHFNDLHDGETMADLTQTIFVWSNNEAFKRMNAHSHTRARAHARTHAHTLTNAICKNAMHWICRAYRPEGSSALCTCTWNVFHSNLCPWKLRSRTLMIWMKLTCEGILSKCICCAKIGASRSSHLFMV